MVGGREENSASPSGPSPRPAEKARSPCRRLPHVESPPRCRASSGSPRPAGTPRARPRRGAKGDPGEVPVHGLEEDLRAIALQVAVEIVRQHGTPLARPPEAAPAASGSETRELRPADHAAPGPPSPRPGSTPGILPRRSSLRARVGPRFMGVALGMPAALDSEAMDIGLPGLGGRLPTRRSRSARTVWHSLPFRQPVPGGYEIGA